MPLRLQEHGLRLRSSTMSFQPISASRFLTLGGVGQRAVHVLVELPQAPERADRDVEHAARAPRDVERALDHRERLVGDLRPACSPAAALICETSDVGRPRRHLAVEPLHLVEHGLGRLRGVGLVVGPEPDRHVRAHRLVGVGQLAAARPRAGAASTSAAATQQDRARPASRMQPVDDAQHDQHAADGERRRAPRRPRARACPASPAGCPSTCRSTPGSRRPPR